MQQVFGYTQEDLKYLIEPMSKSSKDPVGSMGNDSPISILSKKPQNLYTYLSKCLLKFLILLRCDKEKLVTQISLPVGRRFNLLEENENQSSILFLEKPIIDNHTISSIKI